MNLHDSFLTISARVSIPTQEIEFSAIRSGGPGGQNVNKLSTAIHLRFDIAGSSLPEFYKQRLLALRDKRITKEGVIVIKAQQHRSQEQNREEALARLAELIRSVAVVTKRRLPTKPSRAAQGRRLSSKNIHGRQKALRRKPIVGED